MSTTSPTTPGRRERKKAATRQTIADAALRLFLERGYDAVTVREIAEAADVSTTTLLNHFPGKEALVFDEDEDREEALVSAVVDRAAGVTLLEALRTAVTSYRIRSGARSDQPFAEFAQLVRSTPALEEYAHRMWMRHEDALAAALASASGLPDDDRAALVLAHFALEAAVLAARDDQPEATIAAAFDLFERGWTRTGA